jgi:hypothetical protein
MPKPDPDNFEECGSADAIGDEFLVTRGGLVEDAD